MVIIAALKLGGYDIGKSQLISAEEVLYPLFDKKWENTVMNLERHIFYYSLYALDSSKNKPLCALFWY